MDYMHNDNYSKYHKSGANKMQAVAPVALIPLSGAKELASHINQHLVDRRRQYLDDNMILASSEHGLIRNDYRIPIDNVRFASGEGKGVIKQTVRGHDLFIICDITNYSVTYNLFGQEVPMGPDDYYQDLKRIILATSGRARRINVVMPYLYQGRQDMRNSRESLDCAFMLQELLDLGVSSIITFDPHEPRVENAVPRKGIEIAPATYQLIATFLNTCPDVKLSGQNSLMVISPDENGMKRAMYYASVLEVPLGTFFRQRDYTHMVYGRNPIVEHHYLGEDVAGKDILMVSDMMETGTSFIETAHKLKAKNARNIYLISTFAILTNGLEELDKAYAEGTFAKIFVTNLAYINDELRQRPWVEIVDLCQLIAHTIDSINHDLSLSDLLDHTPLIKNLLQEKCERDNFNAYVKSRNETAPH